MSYNFNWIYIFINYNSFYYPNYKKSYLLNDIYLFLFINRDNKRLLFLKKEKKEKKKREKK